MPRELALSAAAIRLLSEADFALGRLTGASGRLVNPHLIGQPYHQAVRSARSSGLLGTLIDALFVVPTLTIAQAAQITGVTPASASSNLQKLLELGIVIETTGRQRGQVFMAKEILSCFGRDLDSSKTAR